MRSAAVFWFDFASSYSYLTLQRAAPLAKSAGVTLHWRPFLLGPIFGAQGWETSPFKLYPAKGAFMWRDMERRAAACDLPLRLPSEFPVNSSQAGKWAVAALEMPQGPEFCAHVSRAYWGNGCDITDPAVLADCAREVGLDPETLGAQAISPELRPRLRQNTEAAQALGVFGAPSITIEREGVVELFWGDEQFEDALSWALRGELAARKP